MAVPSYYVNPASIVFCARADNALNAAGNPAAVGDRVATLVDQSVGGRNLTQSVNANRFTLGEDSSGRKTLDNFSTSVANWLDSASAALNRDNLAMYMVFKPKIICNSAGTPHRTLVAFTTVLANAYIGANSAKMKIFDSAERSAVEPVLEVMNVVSISAVTSSGAKWRVNTNGFTELLTRGASSSGNGIIRVGALTDGLQWLVGSIYEICIYQTGIPSDVEDAAILTAMRGDSIYNPTNSPPYGWEQFDVNRPIYVLSGNSLTHGFFGPDVDSDWPSRAEFHASQSGIQIINKGSASQGLLANSSHVGGMISRDPTRVFPFYPGSAKKPVLIAWEFTNDIWLSALQTGVQEYANVQTYCAAARSDWSGRRTDPLVELTIVMPTMLPRANDATKEGYRITFNSSMVDITKYDQNATYPWVYKKKSGQSANLPDYVVDLNGDVYGGASYDNDGVVLGAPGTQSNTAMFATDQIHFNQAGQGANRMGRIFAPILRLLTPPYVTSAVLGADGVTLTLTLSAAVSGDPTTGFSAKVGGSARSATWVLTDSTHATGTLASPSIAGEAVLWSYDSVTGAMVNGDSVEIDTITDQVVTNNSTLRPGFPFSLFVLRRNR